MDWQLVAIFVVIGMGLAAMGMTAFVLAACVQSGNDAEAERAADRLRGLASANWDYLADVETEHDDG